MTSRRPFRPRNVLLLAVGGVMLVALTSSCQDPTQFTLVISTNAKCHDELKATAIYVGGSLGAVNDKVQTSSPVANTDNCVSGNVGTLVVTPGNSDGAVVVIGGFYGKLPTACVEGHYENCIVARRSFAFIKHTPLSIPIELERDCLNVPCDVNSTCHNGACYAAGVTCATNGDCSHPGDGDAGPLDAGPNAFVDAPADKDASEGGMTGKDAGEDAGEAADAADGEAGPVTPAGVVCKDTGGMLLVSNCGAKDCSGLQACCGPSAMLVCAAPQSCPGAQSIYCCDHNQCPVGQCCLGGNAKALAPILGGAGAEAGVFDASACSPVARMPNSTPGTCQ